MVAVINTKLAFEAFVGAITNSKRGLSELNGKSTILTNKDFLEVSQFGKDMPNAYAWLYHTHKRHDDFPIFGRGDETIFVLCPNKTAPTHKLLEDGNGRRILHSVKCSGCEFCEPERINSSLTSLENKFGRIEKEHSEISEHANRLEAKMGKLMREQGIEPDKPRLRLVKGGAL